MFFTLSPMNRKALSKIKKSPSVLCFLSGSVLALAFAPFNFMFAIPVSFVSFMWLLGKHDKNFFYTIKLGWCYGFGYFLVSLFWIGNALFARIDDFWWLLPAAYLGIPAFAALYLVPVAIATRLAKSPYLKVAFFILAWFASECFRANYFLPFPWNMLGYALASNDYFLQAAYYLDLYGATLLLLMFGTIFYLRSPIFITIGILIPVVLFACGYLRLANAKQDYHDFSIRVIQPNPYEHHFGHPVKAAQLVSDLIDLSQKDLPQDNRIIVWSEAAFPYLVNTKAKGINVLKEITPIHGILIFGVDRFEETKNKKSYHNSMLVADSGGHILAEYDKETLVPFGEYIPFKSLLFFVDILAYGVSEFSHGRNMEEVIELPDLPKFKPLICYEVIFPYVLKQNEKPEWFLVISNDAWYGNAPGPYQHLAMARFTAAQYGIPMVRATNNGVSAIIDPYGRIIEKLDYGIKGVIDHKLPKPLHIATIPVPS